MTIQNTGTRKAGPSTGNALNTTFPFTFKVFSASDVLVTYLNAVSVESALILAVDYNVTLNSDQNASPGGTVNMLWAPAYSTSITLTSQVSNTQNLLLSNAGGFYPSSINDALDRATIQIQQLAEQLSRTFKISVSAIGSPGSYISDYLTQAAASALACATSAIAAAASATQSAGFSSNGSLSALAASISAAAAANSAITATTPTAAALATYLDAFYPAAPPITFASMYVIGGWDLGTVAPASPFTNEIVMRRANLSADSAASYDYGTVP